MGSFKKPLGLALLCIFTQCYLFSEENDFLELLRKKQAEAIEQLSKPKDPIERLREKNKAKEKKINEMKKLGLEAEKKLNTRINQKIKEQQIKKTEEKARLEEEKKKKLEQKIARLKDERKKREAETASIKQERSKRKEEKKRRRAEEKAKREAKIARQKAEKAKRDAEKNKILAEEKASKENIENSLEYLKREQSKINTSDDPIGMLKKIHELYEKQINEMHEIQRESEKESSDKISKKLQEIQNREEKIKEEKAQREAKIASQKEEKQKKIEQEKAEKKRRLAEEKIVKTSKPEPEKIIPDIPEIQEPKKKQTAQLDENILQKIEDEQIAIAKKIEQIKNEQSPININAKKCLSGMGSFMKVLIERNILRIKLLKRDLFGLKIYLNSNSLPQQEQKNLENKIKLLENKITDSEKECLQLSITTEEKNYIEHLSKIGPEQITEFMADPANAQQYQQFYKEFTGNKKNNFIKNTIKYTLIVAGAVVSVSIIVASVFIAAKLIRSHIDRKYANLENIKPNDQEAPNNLSEELTEINDSIIQIANGLREDNEKREEIKRERMKKRGEYARSGLIIIGNDPKNGIELKDVRDNVYQ